MFRFLFGEKPLTLLVLHVCGIITLFVINDICFFPFSSLALHITYLESHVALNPFVHMIPSHRSTSFKLATISNNNNIPIPIASALTRNFSLGLR